MDALIEFVIQIIGEAALEALAPIFLALVWGVSALCVFHVWTGFAISASAAVAAFLFALWLTYMSSRGVKTARKTLVWGAALGAMVSAILVFMALRPH